MVKLMKAKTATKAKAQTKPKTVTHRRWAKKGPDKGKEDSNEGKVPVKAQLGDWGGKDNDNKGYDTDKQQKRWLRMYIEPLRLHAHFFSCSGKEGVWGRVQVAPEPIFQTIGRCRMHVSCANCGQTLKKTHTHFRYI